MPDKENSPAIPWGASGCISAIAGMLLLALGHPQGHVTPKVFFIMHSLRISPKGLVCFGVLLLLGLAALLWKGPDVARKHETVEAIMIAQMPENPSPEPGSTTATSPESPPPESEIAVKPVDSNHSWQLADDGGGTFRLALDEGVVRDADGRETLLKLDPQATDETLARRLADLGAWPVVYLTGEPRGEVTRRVVTPDLRVRLEGADPVDVARSAALVIKDLPEYAPGWAVLSATDPFAALAAMDHLRANGHPSADILLAAQQQKRAMPNDTLINNQWHLKNSNSTRTHINVESVWNYPGSGICGTGIRIGIVDDGLETAHPDLATNVDTANDRDWNGNDSDPNPGNGDDHGTACAGNAGARGNNSLGVSGSAPESTLVGMRLIAAGVTDAQEAEAMAWKNDIIQVKSNSWGPSDTGTLLDGPGPLTLAALENATTHGRDGKGTIFLWAGGNGGGNSDNSNYDGYANSIHTISIGASDSNGNRAYYSEPGANVVVVAPSSGGIGITTTDLTGNKGYNTAPSSRGGDYTDTFGGTSSATPTAAGVVALMLEKNPNLGWRDVQEILIRSAFKIKPGDAGWTTNSAGISFNHDFGAGLIDATAAVNLANDWKNLATRQSSSIAQTGLSASIPDNSTTGITRSFDFSATHLRVEHVTVRVSISHTYRGDLAITLTSPGGMSSRLAEKRADSNDNYTNWTFSSVRHWGEASSGTWTLHIADTAATDIGTLTAATLTLTGASAGDFAAWIVGFPEVGELDGRLDDPDGDGLPNAVENLLGSSPMRWNAGLEGISSNGGSLVFHHTFAAQPASDVIGSYEWSSDLVDWHASGAESNGTIITITGEVVIDQAHPEGWMRVTANATQGALERCFVRLRADAPP